MKLSVCVLVLALACVAVAAVSAQHRRPNEDYTQRWNYVNPAFVGNLAAEQSMFGVWKARLNRAYPTPEAEAKAFVNFQASMARVVKKNQKGFNHGLNTFSDLEPSEWAAKYLNKNVHSAKKHHLLKGSHVRHPRHSVQDIPQNMDWRDRNCVTGVKDQGQCGSCWAFSVVETVESQYAIANNGTRLQDFSPQQIVDCDWGDGNQGCDGGDPAVAYSYVIKNGLMTEDSYPYLSGDDGINGTCVYDPTKVAVRIANFSYATPPCSEGACANQNDILLAQNIVSHGPAGIIVDASNWQDYTWGSFSDCSSAAADMDHGVQVVGYLILSEDHPDVQRVPGTVDIWLVRNSWDESWGEDGYIELVGSSVQNNTCGISNEAIYVGLA